MKTKTLFSLLILFFYFLKISGQCSEFWSILNYYDKAVIFSTDKNGNVLYTYNIPYDEATEIKSPMIEASNGKLYGTACTGGRFKDGVLFEWDPDNQTYKVMFDFKNEESGKYPYGSLFQAENGMIYGMTTLGGIYDMGVLFEWNPANNSYSKIMDFDGWQNGAHPHEALMQGSNGKLYGTTTEGGSNSKGVLFELDPISKTFTKKIDFGFANTSEPVGKLVQSDDGILYGMTKRGGLDPAGAGTIFSFDIEKDSLIIKHSFGAMDQGMWPIGGLHPASDGKLYGVTLSGGSNCIRERDGFRCYGVLFEWDMLTNIFTKKYDFSNNTGSVSEHMISVSDKLYGFCANNHMYSYDIINDSLTYWTIEKDIRMMLRTSDSCFYGLSSDDALYKFNMEDTSITKQYDFKYYKKGRYFEGKLLDFGNGKLYGTALSGGLYNMGVLFEWDIYSKTYTKKIDFNTGGPDGNLIKTKHGKIIGFTYDGNSGTLYEWNPENNEFHNITDFETETEKVRPDQVIQSDDGMIYVVFESVWHIVNQSDTILEYLDSGRVYKYNTNTREYTLIKKGIYEQPIGLITFIRGLAYGISSVGGKYKHGIIYTWDPLTDVYTKKLDMPDFSYEPLILTKEGVFYGYMQSGNWFIYNPTLDTFKINDKIPVDSVHLQFMTEGNDGKFYQFEGSSLLKWDPDLDQLSSVAFNDTSVLFWAMKLTETVPEVLLDTVTIRACQSYSFPGTNHTYSRPGIYRICLKNQSGSDSAVYLNVSIMHNTEMSFNVTACDSYISPGGSTLNSSGIYIDTIPNYCGCDSVITINLQIDHVDTTVVQDRNVLVSADMNGSHQWLNAENNMPVEGETYLTYTPDHNGNYAVIVTQGTCVDTSSAYSVIVTGNEQVIHGDIQLYPNPTDGKVTIDLGRIYNEATLTVMNSTGMVVREIRIRNSQKQEIVLNESGMYLVKIRIGKDETIQRVIKQ